MKKSSVDSDFMAFVRRGNVDVEISSTYAGFRSMILTGVRVVRFPLSSLGGLIKEDEEEDGRWKEMKMIK